MIFIPDLYSLLSFAHRQNKYVQPKCRGASNTLIQTCSRTSTYTYTHALTPAHTHYCTLNMGATTRCTHHTTPVPRPPTLYLRRQAPRRAFIHHNKYQVLPSVQVPSTIPLQPPVRRTGMPLIILATSTFGTLDTLH